jgi:citrate synthase
LRSGKNGKNEKNGTDALDARQAAALLGVKLPTLYAYVSRGLLHSSPGAGGRARRYARRDVERLRERRGLRAGEALRWGEPILETSITEMTPQGPRYRGHSAVELARAGVPFESVATGRSRSRPSPSSGWRAWCPRTHRRCPARSS